jgi:hypothetical protein
MRCYPMRKGHIAAVEFLAAGSDEPLSRKEKRTFTRGWVSCSMGSKFGMGSAGYRT